LPRSSNTCIYNPLTTKQCNFQLIVYCTSVSCSTCVCSYSCTVRNRTDSNCTVSKCCLCFSLHYLKNILQTDHNAFVPILAVCAVPFHLTTVCTAQQSSVPFDTYSALTLILSLPLDTVSVMTPLPILTNNLYYQFCSC